MAAQQRPSPENRAALADLYLVEGHPAEAVSLLRKARAQKPRDPRLLNDLAASLLTSSQETGDPWLALEAIELAQLSLRQQLSLPALFNFALALERLGLRSRASKVWRQYLDRDSVSGWAQEAVRRLRRLELAAGDSATLELDRQQGEQVLLTRWAEQSLAGQQIEAEKALAQAERLAADLPEGGGRLLMASAVAIRQAERDGDKPRRDRLARGHRAFGHAFALWRQEETGAAEALLGEAIEDLKIAESPFELRARVLRAWLVAEPDWVELRLLDRVVS
ncbi:MAG TPA: tetratricopeptide repeat protein, partial [Thermoanaerobaculia bacterium]